MDIKQRTVLGVYEQSSAQLFEIGEYVLADSSPGRISRHTMMINGCARLEVLYKRRMVPWTWKKLLI
jgi:hypothetical protein